MLNPDRNSDAKTDFLKFTYKEVLDATKHQDDKIGRILTALAFLSVSAFAMANLDQGKLLFQEFHIGEERSFHVAGYALGIFVVGVMATILLLMSSFSTPLRFPNMKESEEKKSKELIPKEFSTFYFNEIATIPLEDWKEFWWKDSSIIEKRTKEALVKETHNISLRVNLKYARMTEAVAIFSLSVLAYAMSAMFIIFAAFHRSSMDVPDKSFPSIEISLSNRLALAILFCLYMLIQIHSSYQGRNESVENGVKKKDTNWKFGGISMVILGSILSLSILGSSQKCKIPLIVILSIFLFSYSILNLSTIPIVDNKTWKFYKYKTWKFYKPVSRALMKDAYERVSKHHQNEQKEIAKNEVGEKQTLTDEKVLLKMAENEIQFFRFLFLLVQISILIFSIVLLYCNYSYRSQIFGAVVLMAVIVLKGGLEPTLVSIRSRYLYRHKFERGAYKFGFRKFSFSRESQPFTIPRKS